MKEYINGKAAVIVYDKNKITAEKVKNKIKGLNGFYFLDIFNIIIIEQTETSEIVDTSTTFCFFSNFTQQLNISNEHKQRLKILMQNLPTSNIKYANFGYSISWKC